MSKYTRLITVLVATLAFAGNAAAQGRGLPKGATVVDGLDKTRYLGTWYEIARYDFAFEKNLSDTTATYALRDDGKIAVTNRGYNYLKGKWTEARAKARFRGSDSVGALEVSFFGPFYAAYNIIALDPEYRYALVVGDSTKYLWILSRTTEIPDDVKAEYLAIAEGLGYDLTAMVWVEHTRH
ncbi:MAG TPA: lipocalin family protein [Spirochaetales bacterium]|nr:lipocalin family protein [Spirochaetales bacterium]HPB66819.1 lipocalin family protein [Spirochaetales bacterium]